MYSFDSSCSFPSLCLSCLFVVGASMQPSPATAIDYDPNGKRNCTDSNAQNPSARATPIPFCEEERFDAAGFQKFVPMIETPSNADVPSHRQLLHPHDRIRTRTHPQSGQGRLRLWKPLLGLAPWLHSGNTEGYGSRPPGAAKGAGET
jgi:hypothetical protein